MLPFQGLAGGVVDRFVHFGILPCGSLIDLAVDFLAFLGSSQAVMEAADEHRPEGVVGKFLLQLTEEAQGFLVLLFAGARVVLGEIKLRFRPPQFALLGAELELLKAFRAAAARKA